MKRFILSTVIILSAAICHSLLVANTASAQLFAVSNEDVNGTNLLTLDKTNGMVITTTPLDIGGVSGLTFDATSQTLYGFDSLNFDVVEIDTTTGNTAVVADLNFLLNAIAFDTTTNVLIGIDSEVNQNLFSIDTDTGLATEGLLVSTNGGIQGLTFDDSGRLLATDVNLDRLVSIDTSSGNQTNLLDLAPAGFPRMFSLAFDPTTGSLFGVDAPVGQDELARFDPLGPGFDGSSVGLITGSTNIVSLAFSGQSNVPEPSSATMVVVGLLALCYKRPKKPLNR